MRKPGGVWEVMVPVTNEELALAFQLGDIYAGEELLRNVESLIRHQASKMCRDGSLLEDLLQEAGLLSSLPLGIMTLRGEHSFSHTLCRESGRLWWSIWQRLLYLSLCQRGGISSCCGWASW